MIFAALAMGCILWSAMTSSYLMWHHIDMRTTVHLTDEAYQVALHHAKACNIGLGKAVSDLIIRGGKSELPLKEESGLLIFDPPEELPRISAEQVKRLAEEW